MEWHANERARAARAARRSATAEVANATCIRSATPGSRQPTSEARVVARKRNRSAGSARRVHGETMKGRDQKARTSTSQSGHQYGIRTKNKRQGSRSRPWNAHSQEPEARSGPMKSAIAGNAGRARGLHRTCPSSTDCGRRRKDNPSCAPRDRIGCPRDSASSCRHRPRGAHPHSTLNVHTGGLPPDASQVTRPVSHVHPRLAPFAPVHRRLGPSCQHSSRSRARTVRAVGTRSVHGLGTKAAYRRSASQ